MFTCWKFCFLLRVWIARLDISQYALRWISPNSPIWIVPQVLAAAAAAASKDGNFPFSLLIVNYQKKSARGKNISFFPVRARGRLCAPRPAETFIQMSIYSKLVSTKRGREYICNCNNRISCAGNARAFASLCPCFDASDRSSSFAGAPSTENSRPSLSRGRTFLVPSRSTLSPARAPWMHNRSNIIRIPVCRVCC